MIKKYLQHPFILSLQERFNAFKESKNGKMLSKVLKYTFQIGIFAYLFHQLSQIGWMNVLKALPINPLFYILLLVHYFVLPISEQFIYRMSLKFSFWEGVKVFVKKKILNTDVYVYSGEAYFYVWGKKNLEEDHKHIFNVIKDNNIISSIASTFMAIVLLVIFLYVAQDNLLEGIDISFDTVKWVLITALFSLPIIVYLLRFIISMSTAIASKVFGIHLFRFVVTYGLEVMQWMVVMPEIPLHIWFVYLGSKMIGSRLPIPNFDIVFISVSAYISSYLGTDEASILALMAAVTAVNKLINIVFLSLLSIFGEDRIIKDQKAGIEEITLDKPKEIFND